MQQFLGSEEAEKSHRSHLGSTECNIILAELSWYERRTGGKEAWTFEAAKALLESHCSMQGWSLWLQPGDTQNSPSASVMTQVETGRLTAGSLRERELLHVMWSEESLQLSSYSKNLPTKIILWAIGIAAGRGQQHPLWPVRVLALAPCSIVVTQTNQSIRGLAKSSNAKTSKSDFPGWEKKSIWVCLHGFHSHSISAPLCREGRGRAVGEPTAQSSTVSWGWRPWGAHTNPSSTGSFPNYSEVGGERNAFPISHKNLLSQKLYPSQSRKVSNKEERAKD